MIVRNHLQKGENYGIRYNDEEYVIKYEFYASNLMPDITVLEK